MTALGAALLQVPAVLAECNREALVSAANAYLAAQTAGQLGDFAKLLSADNITYMENNKKADLKTGLLTKALAIDHKRTTVDTVNCASYTELVSTGGPYVIGTQLRHTDEKTITLVDTIAATTGALFFNAKRTLEYISKEDWGTIEPSKRDSRKAIQDAADAYLDMWHNKTAIDLVPWGTPCQRVEGSSTCSRYFSNLSGHPCLLRQFTVLFPYPPSWMQRFRLRSPSTRFPGHQSQRRPKVLTLEPIVVVQPSCRAGAPTNGGSKPITMRRYVIDETVGSCDVLCAFAGSTPDSHEFRLVGGKLMLVHTITLSNK
jgi:hypothetical protein